MKTRSILPFAVFGILLALLLALSACDGDDEPENGEFDASRFGGLYQFREDLNDGKKRAFKCYEKTGLSLSKAVELDSGLLEESIGANVAFPHGAKMQKYNYVVDLKGKIIVAQWNVNDLARVVGDAKATAQAMGDAKATAQAVGDAEANAEEDTEETECKGKKCIGDADFIPQAPRKMVNWFPEDKGEDLVADPQSPCWLDRDDKKGLLDAISKHLMLAQGVDDDGNGKAIGDFKVQKWATNDEDDWKKAEVAYAGELIVDLVSCTYSLNNDSGTYQLDDRPPNPGKLPEVAKHFAKEIGVGPNLYVDVVLDPTTKNKSKDKHPTDNLFDTTRKISNAPPLCP